MCLSIALALTFFVVWLGLTLSRASGIPWPRVRPTKLSMGLAGLTLAASVSLMAFDARLTACRPGEAQPSAAGAVAGTTPVSPSSSAPPAPAGVQVVSARELTAAPSTTGATSSGGDSGYFGRLFMNLATIGILFAFLYPLWKWSTKPSKS